MIWVGYKYIRTKLLGDRQSYLCEISVNGYSNSVYISDFLAAMLRVAISQSFASASTGLFKHCLLLLLDVILLFICAAGVNCLTLVSCPPRRNTITHINWSETYPNISIENRTSQCRTLQAQTLAEKRKQHYGIWGQPPLIEWQLKRRISCPILLDPSPRRHIVRQLLVTTKTSRRGPCRRLVPKRLYRRWKDTVCK